MSTQVNLENTQQQMRKGILEFVILSVLARNDAYTSDIIAELKKAQLIVVEGTLYPLLTRLKNGGLLTYRWEESTQGPPRKYYALTEEGRNFLVALKSTWEELTIAVDHISKNN
ncbi:MAG: PadR family transcriptional regulator [Candidatus Competibacteraceae bacterium]|nr:PadR family transcriptional regulator [Candidatus Competibacteraceae bacterium]